jgi:hypothetical protein
MAVDAIHSQDYANNKVALYTAASSHILDSGYKTLDDIRGSDWILARLLGISNEQRGRSTIIARELVDQGLISGIIPTGQPISKASSISHYLNREVVRDVDVWRANVRMAVSELFPTLDHVQYSGAIGTAIGLSRDYVQQNQAFARALVEGNFISAEIPTLHPLGGRPGGSNYFLPEIIASSEIRYANLRKAVTDRFPRIDCVQPDRALATALGVLEGDRGSRYALARAIISDGILSPVLQKSYLEFSDIRIADYVNPKIVLDQEIRHRNASLVIECRNPGLSNASHDPMVLAALGITEHRARKQPTLVARALVEGDFGYSPSVELLTGTDTSDARLLLDRRVVRDVRELEKSLSALIRGRFSNLDEIRTEDLDLGSILELTRTQRGTTWGLSAALVEKEYMSPEIPLEHTRELTSFSTAYLDPRIIKDATQRHINLQLIIKERFQTLDDVRDSLALASVLSIPRDEASSSIAHARRLVDLRLMSSEIPSQHKTPSGRISNYFNPDVISNPELIRTNIRKAVLERFSNLDEVVYVQSIATALGVEAKLKDKAETFARVLVERGIFPSSMPPGHEHFKRMGNHPTRYINPSIILNRETLIQNFKRVIDTLYTNLDDVTRKGSVATFLGLDDETPASTSRIARALVDGGYLSPIIPENHILSSKAGLSNYLNPEVVANRDILEDNFKRAISWTYKDLEDIVTHSALATAMGLIGEDRKRPSALARLLTKKGFISPHYVYTETYRSLHRYFDPHFVGSEVAENNIGRYLQNTYQNINELHSRIPYFATICSGFGIERKISKLKEEVLKRGFFSKEEGIDICYQLPSEFERRMFSSPSESSRESQWDERTISSGVHQQRSQLSHFAKGEAFEQLVGMFLAISQPEDLLIPQYCLDIDHKSGYFGKRVDFRIGERFIEVKWGGAEDNIHSTFNSHKESIGPEVDYQLVTLHENSRVTVPYITFERLVGNDLLAPQFKQVVSILERFADQKDGAILGTLRDYFYSANVRARSLNIEEKRPFLKDSLDQIIAADESELETILLARINRCFPSLEAHFYHQGQLYRGFISPQALQHEDPLRFQVYYQFGDLTFQHGIDRDIAVMIELSDSFTPSIRASGALPSKQYYHRAPVFQLPGGIKLTSNRNCREAGTILIESLEDMKEAFKYSGDLFEFGLQYIGRYGYDC